MGVLEAIFLGVVQGLTEFLPISSSAHLLIVPWLFGWSEPGLAFNVALHLGTLLAVVTYFWRDLLAMAAGLLRGLRTRRWTADPDARLALIIAIGSIPAAVAGFLGSDALDAYFHSGGGGDQAIMVSALLLIGLGLLLALAEWLARHRRGLSEINAWDGIVVGLAQALALLPGVSRSGSTITAGLFLGLRREAAARFSFLLGVPAIVGAGLLEGVKLLQVGLPAGERVIFAAGTISAAVVGYLAIAFLLRFLQRYSTMVFVAYRLILGLVLLAVVTLRT
ncbi:Undecaprenyl-diphosphatase [bacterium HR26]|nr:Undecaprenyl-diphosphatase [bacterium HR26]